MSTYTETISEKLNDLLEKTYDAEKGYKKASDNTDNPYLKSFFDKKSAERHTYGQELKSEITNFGQKWEKDGSVTGALHRTWMDVKSLFSADDDEAMLEEAIRGEKASVEEYRDVLSDTSLPHSTATILTQQMNQIQADLNQVKRLEDLS
ncbi:PA2169 family four-helix-bundle protein [Arenibacter sp. F26102]|uniref:ferritin-like domain-containing protein n=1 Tax=Arenibacter sp. F26102 TaxID=2926416 RepID=UPI001FF6EB19|nr:PA2169 family four-helix-bundle protein [Arenibacter sp. F26102]MCK0144892.1 PA2169 family four-helix-bundle protein [Arenibacter sp. F26102]